VTGATSGIGQAVAWELAAAGCPAVAVRIDVSSDGLVRTGFAQVTTALEAIDVVASIAGVSPSVMADMSLARRRSVVDGGMTLHPPDAG